MPLYPARNLNFINLKDYCKIDGSSDDSLGFSFAYNLAASLNMALYHPGGTLIKGNDTLQPNVMIFGAGPGESIIKLKNAANTDLFSANTGNINLSGTFGTGSATGTNFWSIRNVTLDGNKANQSSGPSYPIRAYGYGHVLEHVEIINGYTSGILIDWNNTANPAGNTTIIRWNDVSIHDNNGIGLEIGGPTDIQGSNINSFHNGSHCLHIGPNAGGLQFSDSHFWGPALAVNAVAMLNEANGCIFTNCQFEGSDVVQIVDLNGDNSYIGCRIYAAPAGNVIGMQLGQLAGGTPYNGSVYQSAGLTTAIGTSNNFIQAQFRDCQSGAINEVSTGSNFYIFRVNQVSGTSIASGGGYLGASSTAIIMVTGLTPDGTSGKGGTFQLGNVVGFAAMVAYDHSGNQAFELNNYNGGFAVLSGKLFQGYSDNGVTRTMQIDTSTGDLTTNGYLATGQSTTAPALATNGTITTSNIGEARVAPTGNVTGIILQAGTVAGQEVTVVNESAFTVTFAAVGTSFVADGVSAVISANRCMFFKWDSAVSKWYHS